VPPVKREVRPKTIVFDDLPNRVLCLLRRAGTVRVDEDVAVISARGDASAETGANFVLDPVNAQAIPYTNVLYFFIGASLAGPDLTPQNFERGMFRYDSPDSTALRPHVSWGDTKLWGSTPDHHSSDDGAIIWWDPKAKGQDEVGKDGDGEYRYVDMGKRFLPGAFPTDPVKFFDPANTITVLKTRPTEDTPPDYPSPAK